LRKQLRAVHARDPAGALDVPAEGLQELLDVDLLELLARRAEIDAVVAELRQVGTGHAIALRGQDRQPQHVAKLADVSRPVVRAELFPSLWLELAQVLLVDFARDLAGDPED